MATSMKSLLRLSSVLRGLSSHSVTNSCVLRSALLSYTRWCSSSSAKEVAHADKRNSEKKKKLQIEHLPAHGCNDIKNKYPQPSNAKDSSSVKMSHIAALHPDRTLLMPLVSLSLYSLRKASKQAKKDKNGIQGFANRIEYLSHHLEVAVVDLIPVLAKHSALLTVGFDRLERKMTILKEAQISSEYILKDLWIFNYNEELLSSRISAAQQAKVVLKPWMLRCSEDTFETVITKYSETQRILNGATEIAYLAQKLECTEDYIKLIMEKTKMLKSVNISKVEQVLNFLREKGYSPQEIRLFPNVFCSSVQTLIKRFEEFRSLRNTPPTIPQLCLSAKKFQNVYKKNVS